MQPRNDREGQRPPKSNQGEAFTELDFEILWRRAIARRRREWVDRWFWITLAVCIPGTIFSVWLFIYMAMHGMLR